MEPQVPTSFIPKRPIATDTNGSTGHRNRSVGLLSFLTAIIVIGTIVAFIGVYLYERSLTSQRVSLEASIEDARGGIGSDFLAEMKRLSARIDGVQQLIQHHIVVSPIFEALESSTLRTVQYRSFSYEFSTDAASKSDVVKVNLAGTARSYSTIALQSDAFTQSKIIRNPVFSGLTVDDKTNAVNFKLTFDVSPADLSYPAFIDSRSKATVIPAVPAAQVNPSAPGDASTQ